MLDHDAAFEQLRALLRRHADGLTVTADTASRFCLEAGPGPATLAAWRGERRRDTLPVAWVERAKSYVGYHLMGLNGNASLTDRLSPQLRARMHGKTCFNFREAEPALVAELDATTAAAIDALERGGFMTREK